ncbi:vacuolar protein sorting-associated protein 37A-like [Lineus longissimus]|uniref:vacuolar protein sorting-associated protein 37A-like n=1 Tax=Lineus longissimus TaxID=88925 RepID=UPI002B4DAC4D
MSWFGFGKQKSNLPPATPLQTHRSRQIESLKTFNQNVTELQRDVEYRVSTSVLGKNVCLHINLPPQFPQEPPLVKVTPPLHHPWVSDKMIVIGCPSLNNFVMHSDLGQIIRQIVDEFQRNHPAFIAQAPQNSGHMPYTRHPGSQNNAPTIPSSGAYPSAGYKPPGQMPTLPARPVRPAPAPPNRRDHPPPQRSASPPSNSYLNYDFPEVPTSFPELNELSVSELQDLASGGNEEILLHYIKASPQLEAVTGLREKTWKENEELARANLDRKPEIEHLKMHLLEKFDVMNDLRKEFDIKTRKQEELRDRFLPGNFQTQLKMVTLQAEEESEQVAEKFLNGKIDIDEFKKQFMDVRTLSHCRRAKEERLNQHLSSNQRVYDYRT